MHDGSLYIYAHVLSSVVSIIIVQWYMSLFHCFCFILLFDALIIVQNNIFCVFGDKGNVKM